MVPPVFTAPVFPQPALGGTPVAGGLPPLPQDRLSITPDRVLAPVGSEVILKAGLCTRENFLLTDSQVDWLLARDGAGEFVSLGGRGWCKDPWLPWNKSKKIDNQYGTGYTAKVPLLITRGTADTRDDLQIEPGEAWASVTSPVEGTSRITAVAPEIETWASRRATATIYWVDVQWIFPPAVVTAGASQVLTTTVRRQTDGTPIVGWLVRYEVAAGGGALRGGESGQVVEVPTDSQGRASIDVTPTGSSGTTTQINFQLVRPERFAGSTAPRLVIARGTSRVDWTEGGTDYLPTPDNLDGPTPDYPLPGEVSPPPPLPSTQPNPAPPVTRRGAVLELEVFTNDTQTEVGKQVRFEVVVRNTGDTAATGVMLNDVYDPGLAHQKDPDRKLEIAKTLIDLEPGAVISEFLSFDVRQAGELCQTFKVTCNEGALAEKIACIESRSPQVLPQGELKVDKQGPRLQNVGELALFTISVRNVGAAALTNIEVIDSYDPELQAQPSKDAQLLNGSLIWRIERLEAGQTWQREVRCRCRAEKIKAIGTVSVTADTGAGAVSSSAISETEIGPMDQDVVPPITQPPGGDVLPEVGPGSGLPPGSGAVPTGPVAEGPLNMELLLFANPVRAGTQTTFQIVVRNVSADSDQQVQLRVLFPPELEPDTTTIQRPPNIQVQFKSPELLFSPIAELRSGEALTFTISSNVKQAGVRNLTAELISRKMPQGIRRAQQIDIIGR